MQSTVPDPRPLKDCIAVVTGASRGAGRAIAVELGAAGATVYVTGRSTRQQAAPGYDQILTLSGLQAPPGDIDSTAEAVSAAGGLGIAVPCDHRDDAQVGALFERVQREQGRVDLLVNNAWGGHESFDGVFDAPFWQQPLAHWQTMVDGGVRNHLLASRHAAPLMVARRQGMIVTTTFHDAGHYLHGNLFYDLAKSAMTRLAFGMAQDLRPYGVASIAVSPGWMRTEFVLLGHQTDEAHWTERPALARSESPHYLGRAVVALATDPEAMGLTGSVQLVAELAQRYGFTDLDGRQPPSFALDAG